MGKLLLNPEYELYERNSKAFCSTIQVAEKFGKRHDHVVRDIESKIIGTAPQNFTAPNFGETKIKDRSGRMNKCYILTRDAFSLVVMGFTGKKAMQFKVDFISRFNQMEDFIKSLYAAKLEHPAFTEAVMLAHDEPKHYHFSNEADMINRIVLGVPAKEFRERRGIAKGESIRPYLSTFEISAVEKLQRADIGLLFARHGFQERKEILSTVLEQLKNSARALAA